MKIDFITIVLIVLKLTILIFPKDLEKFEKLNINHSELRRNLKPQTYKLSREKDIQDVGLDKKHKCLLPITAREYLWSVQETAKEKVRYQTNKIID